MGSFKNFLTTGTDHVQFFKDSPKIRQHSPVFPTLVFGQCLVISTNAIFYYRLIRTDKVIFHSRLFNFLSNRRIC